MDRDSVNKTTTIAKAVTGTGKVLRIFLAGLLLVSSCLSVANADDSDSESKKKRLISHGAMEYVKDVVEGVESAPGMGGARARAGAGQPPR